MRREKDKGGEGKGMEWVNNRKEESRVDKRRGGEGKQG